MTDAVDFVQVAREALVEAIDPHVEIVAITGRDQENIVAWEPDRIVERPVLAYQFIDAAELGADGDTRRVLFQISASADTEAQAHELLGAVERILDQPLFLSLSTPFDAFVERKIRRGFDLDVYVRVSRPYPVAA